jgi:hypothetical protein
VWIVYTKNEENSYSCKIFLYICSPKTNLIMRKSIISIMSLTMMLMTFSCSNDDVVYDKKPDVVTTCKGRVIVEVVEHQIKFMSRKTGKLVSVFTAGGEFRIDGYNRGVYYNDPPFDNIKGVVTNEIKSHTETDVENLACNLANKIDGSNINWLDNDYFTLLQPTTTTTTTYIYN